MRHNIGHSTLCVNKVFFFLFSEDDVQKIVSVCVDGKEAQMVFIDHAHSDMAVRKNPHYALRTYFFIHI